MTIKQDAKRIKINTELLCDVTCQMKIKVQENRIINSILI